MNYEAFVSYFNEQDPYSSHNHIKLKHLEEGISEAEVVLTPKSFNRMQIMHGGLLFSLADVAAGTCVMTHGIQCVTLNTDIHFIKPGLSGTITAYAKELYHGGKTAICNVQIKDEKQTLLATATITMYLTGKPLPQEFFVES